MKGARLLLNYLMDLGAGTLFGLPGETSLPLYHELTEEREMRHVLMRDERNSAYAAIGFAKASHSLGLVEAPSGGGALYVLPGLSEATRSSIPLLSMTSDLPSQVQERGALTELDQLSLLKSAVKSIRYVRSASELQNAVISATREALSGRPGPSHLVLPLDMLEGDAEAPSALPASFRPQLPFSRFMPGREQIAQAARAILSSSHPVIVAGGGIHLSYAYSELKLFAEKLLIPVGTTLSGKGSFPENHPLSIGVVGENSAKKFANDMLIESDLVIFAGCKLGSVATFNWTVPEEDRTVIHIDICPEWAGRNFERNRVMHLTGDAALTMSALSDACMHHIPSGREERIVLIRKLSRDWLEGLDYSAGNKLRPPLLFRAIRSVYGERKMIVVADPGTSTPASASLLPVDPAGPRYLILRSHGALGNGMGMSIGARIARPDHDVLLFTGDGSLGMSAFEIETSVRENAPLRIFLFSNSSFSWIKAHMRFLYDTMKYRSLDFGNSDWLKVAEGLGAEALRLDAEGLEEELRITSGSDRTVLHLIDSIPLEEEPPLYWPWLKHG